MTRRFFPGKRVNIIFAFSLYKKKKENLSNHVSLDISSETIRFLFFALKIISSNSFRS